MKKIILVLSSLLVMGISAGAQEFVPGWNFQVKGGIDAMKCETMTLTDAITPEGAIAIGYKFTPVIGARLDLSGLKSGCEDYKWGFLQPSLDLTVDLCNLFGDYKFRKVNPYFLAGIGGFSYFGNDDALAIGASDSFKPWDGSRFGLSGRVGAGLDFFVGKAFAISIEASGNVVPDDVNSSDGPKPDGRLAAYVGLKYDLSRAKSIKATDDKIAAAAAAAAAAKAAADKAAAEKAAAEAAAAAKAAADKAAAEKAAAEKAAAEKAAAERAAARQSANNVLFVIGQSKIRDNQKDKLQAVIDKANAYPEAKIIVSGYADKETGSAAWNMKLSQKRAENVTKALVEKGIAADRIVTEYYGSEVNPFDTPAENRVAVAVTR